MFLIPRYFHPIGFLNDTLIYINLKTSFSHTVVYCFLFVERLRVAETLYANTFRHKLFEMLPNKIRHT